MWPAIALGTALFLCGFIAWVAWCSGVQYETKRRDDVLRRLTVPIRPPRALPFEPPPARPAVPTDQGRGDLGAQRRDCRAAHDGAPRPGSLSDRLRLAAAAEAGR